MSLRITFTIDTDSYIFLLTLQYEHFVSSVSLVSTFLASMITAILLEELVSKTHAEINKLGYAPLIVIIAYSYFCLRFRTR